MSDSAIVAIIFLSPVEDGFGEGERGDDKACERSDWGTQDMGLIDVGEVEDVFEDVQ